MLSTLAVFAFGAIALAGAAFWVLRAYRDAGGRRGRTAIVACAVVALVGLGIYLAIGRPELPDAPYAQRLAALKHRDPTTYSFGEALAILAEAARERPDDATPHLYSGRLLLAQGRAAEAMRAYDAALRRAPTSPEALLGLGRAIVALEGGVTPEATAAFQQAAALDESDPTPWIYQAMAAMEAEDGAAAREFWREAYTRMREDDPRRDMAARMSREAGR